MTEQNADIRAALLRAEAALRDAIGRADPERAGDQAPMKDLQEALGLVAGWRVGLEAGRWKGRSDRHELGGDDGGAP